MLPPSAIVTGCQRWLRLLRTSSLAQASLILRTDSRYSDLTQSQYGSALELLKTIGALDDSSRNLALSEQFEAASDAQMGSILFERIIEHAAPAWLPDSDILIPDPGELPEDATKLAHALGLKDQQCFWAVRNVHRRIDLARRKLVGDAGELAVLHYLERRWPGTTVHVANIGDGYGFDIAFQHNQREWHLEIKSTTRRGRMTIYLSRNEYEVSRTDPYWRLIVVGLDADLQIKAIATLAPGYLENLAPIDTSVKTRWQSASYDVAGDMLMSGICLAEKPAESAAIVRIDHTPSVGTPSWFEWMPAA